MYDAAQIDAANAYTVMDIRFAANRSHWSCLKQSLSPW